MPKRKANDIIFEIDSEDVDSSSEDENQKKTPISSKKHCGEVVESIYKAKQGTGEVIDVESSSDDVLEVLETETVPNGGKEVITVSQSQLTTEVTLIDRIQESDTSSQEKDYGDKNSLSSEESGEYNMEIAGCENKPPLMTVHFRDKMIAKKFKSKLKEFILGLFKVHEDNGGTESESDTDLELDILAEDVGDDSVNDGGTADDLFFVDTAPMDDNTVIPEYSKTCELLTTTTSNIQEVAPVRERKSGPICFNCQGSHTLRDCEEPKSAQRIAESRKIMASYKTGRYHIDDDQKYGHLAPGRISGQLRYAMDLNRDKVPTFIYRMRMLGYPPGWLEEARICHSGITMFDSKGQEITDPDEEEGEQVEPGSKDKFDIKKIIDFPGFNVPLRSTYLEEGERFGFPPMSEEDSKLNMLQMLAPNAMKAYKRKKLALFPCGDEQSVEGMGTMHIDNGEGIPEFPVLPPLPDEAPPPIPPPPLSANSTLEYDQLLSEDMIVLDECDGSVDDEDEVSLDDLEEKKKKIMKALNAGSETSTPSKTDSVKPNETTTPISEKKQSENPSSPSVSTSQASTEKGKVISSSFGTPVMNSCKFKTIPGGNNFAKDICDIINFENLPESVGKYAKISGLLKKVKSAVDKIQES